MWKFQSHFATNWKQIRIPPQGNVVRLEATANEERGEGVVKSWQIYSARGHKRVPSGTEGGASDHAPERPGHTLRGPKARACICSSHQNNNRGSAAVKIQNPHPETRWRMPKSSGGEGLSFLMGEGKRRKQIVQADGEMEHWKQLLDFSVWHLLQHHRAGWARVWARNANGVSCPES